MNEQFPNPVNPEDEKIDQKLGKVAEQTHANAQFAAELEEKLRATHHQRLNPFIAVFKQISPALRWSVLMIVLALALSWSIKTLVPAPQPATNNTPVTTETATPAPDVAEPTATISSEEGGYDFRGAKLYLKGPLPESPDQARIYLLKKDEPATREQARAIAERLGIQGDMYTAPGLIYGTTNFVISDGKQFLQVHSNRYFMYTSDMAKNNRHTDGFPNDNAETLIREFLQAHGFDSNVRVNADPWRGGYDVQPLSPDSIPMQYESFTQTVMRVTLDENGEVLRLDSALMEYDPTPVGEYSLITAEEALQKLLDDSQPQGKMEFFHSTGTPFRDWDREYPDGQPVTVYGYVTSNPPVDPGRPALVLIDGIPAKGNTQGMESLDYYTFIQANGQYVIEEGVRKFNVDAWERYGQPAYLSGILHAEGNQIILVTDDGSDKQYPLIDPPAEVPVDTEVGVSQVSVEGVIVNDKMDWRFIRYDENVNESSGGGGGGGLGFYQLNLSGTPVAFPTATAGTQIDPGAGNYIVKEGDTCGGIAGQFGVSVQSIIDQNQLSAECVIAVGQALVIPGVAVPPAESTYVVQENDTLASIASNFGVTVDALMQANGITENVVFLGQHLIIPNGQQSANNPLTGIYTVQEGDTLSGIARDFETTVDTLKQLNGLTDESISPGQTLSIPIPEPTEQQVEDLRGYLSIAIHEKADGTSTKEYTLEAAEENGSRLYMMEGPMLGELDPYNALPILVSGTIDTMGKLTVESYKIPYPDLQFQILNGTQSTAQLEGQDVIVFTTEDGKSYVEFLATNQIPLTAESMTSEFGDPLQQEVLIIPDETYGGMPVAHVFQSVMVLENGPELEIQSNRIYTYSDSEFPDPGNYTPPNLTITDVELAYFVSNPYYQVNDPNYDQRSPYLQPVWHFHGRYDDGNEFDVLIQALQQQFLLPDLAPGLSPG